MTRLRFLAVTGALPATMMTVAACSSTPAPAAAAATSTPATSTPSATSTGATATASAPATTPPATSSADQAAFASALAAWKNAATANAATMGMYFHQAADDLRAANDPSYAKPIDELTYLEHLPATNDTPPQQANAHADVKALDSLFGTPGLLT